MNVALRRPMTVTEFLAWEEQQEPRYEFDGFKPVAMVGVTRAHATIQGNLLVFLGNRLRGTRCRAFGSDLKIGVAGSIRYPDVFVARTPGAGSQTVVSDPVVVFEILSQGSALTDRVIKNSEYRQTESILRHVMLE
jgi:Uma2 family endonuclease